MHANRELSLQVAPGLVFGLLGPNGAGKTTLVKQIIGLAAPTSGSITLDGLDVVAHPAQARKRVSYLPQGSLPIDGLNVHEAITLATRVRGATRREARERTNALVDSLDLGEWRDTPGHRLSGGVRRLVGFAMAVSWPTSLVILDEPTNDVDPVRRRHLWSEIRRLGEQGTTVLLVTHNVLEAEQAVDRLAVIADGRILAEGTPGGLKQEHVAELRLSVRLRDSHQTLRLPGFVLEQPAPLHTGRRIRVAIKESDATRALDWARNARATGEIEEYALAPVDLEDTYIRLVGEVSNS